MKACHDGPVGGLTRSGTPIFGPLLPMGVSRAEPSALAPPPTPPAYTGPLTSAPRTQPMSALRHD